MLLVVAGMMSCNGNVPEVKLRTKACAVMPSPRASASACALDGKGYVFGGRAQNGKYLNDLWQYDPVADQWTQISSFPGKARVKPILVACDGALYAGMGFSGERVYDDSCYLRDLWRYTPADGQWTKLARTPDRNTVSAVPYVLNRRIYALHGTGWSYTDDIVRYDIAANRWDSVPENGSRAEACFAAAGGQCEGRCFFGSGLNRLNLRNWYEVDLETNTWIQRTDILGKGRQLCAYCSTNAHVYLFGGRYFAGEHTDGEVFGEYLRYRVADDSWERCGDMPCGRAENMIAFSIDGKAYFGLGEDENGQLIDKLYCIEE